MTQDKILAGSEWFYPVSRDALLEDEFESQILANASEIFPGFRPVPFKETVASVDFGTAQPDFLIFDSQFRSWWVVEVEMSRHSFASHVEPQVAALAHGAFTEFHVGRVTNRFTDDQDKDRISQLMLSVQPNVLVVVNEACEDWRLPLRTHEAYLITVMPYQSRQGRYIFRQHGEIPGQRSTILSSIQIRRDVARAVVVDNRAALPFEQRQQITILVGGMPTSWRCHFVGNTLMLFCLEGRFPFESTARNYVLLQKATGEFAIEKQTSRIVGTCL